MSDTAEISLALLARQQAERSLLKLTNQVLGTPKHLGKFVYEFEYPRGRQVKGKYNLLRHFGTIWAMLAAYQQILDHRDYSNTLRNAWLGMEWAKNKYAQELSLPIPHDPASIQPLFIVWHDATTLGGNALALLAYVEFINCLLADEFKNSTFRLRDYPRIIEHAEGFALALHKLLLPHNFPRIIHKAEFPSLIPMEFVSEYYIGEALFALARWKRICQQLKSTIHLPITELISYQNYSKVWELIQQLARTNYGVEFQSHWMCYAIACEMDNNLLLGPSLLPYLINLVQDIITRPDYRLRKQSTPIACRSEALLAALQVLQKITSSEHPQITDILRGIHRTLRENIALQLEYARSDGSVIQGDGSNLVRIDYIQHNMASFINFAKIYLQQ